MTTPLGGPTADPDQVPANLQAIPAAQLRRDPPRSVADAMARSFNSVAIGEAQSNPFQPEVTFRGFSASALLGNPIGLSVFVDGVRVNEPFGDTVLWDLVPSAAIGSLVLIPGANPVFGLNTLGGALSIRTRSGSTSPGTEGRLAAGSFGRRSVSATAGLDGEVLDGFVAVQHEREDGWRDHSPSRVRQLFAKGGWRKGGTEIEATYTHAGNRLVGNGLVPERFLQARRSAIYTHPDVTEPRLHFLNLTARHEIGAGTLLTANVYHRRLSMGTFNADAEFDDGGTPDEPGDDGHEAENRRTELRTRSSGAALQLDARRELAGFVHRFAIGASHDAGRSVFAQLEQDAQFTGDRGTVPAGDFELARRVLGTNTYRGIYFTDTIALADRWHATVSGRYNHARVGLRDLTGELPALDGDHRFSRWSPALGATWAASRAVTLFAGYNEGFRVPTAIELACADPGEPCALPVGLVGDPPLEPVVARSWEVGARGELARAVRWNVAAYSTALSDDILFTAVRGGRGFFSNVAKTRRRGLEASVRGEMPGARWRVSYAHTRATFETSAALFNPLANAADPDQPGALAVQPGDQLPGIPRHQLKLGLEYEPLAGVTLGAHWSHVSSQVLRGDEGNAASRLAGYRVLDLRLEWRLGPGATLFARVDNALDREYATLGALARNAFGADGRPLQGAGPGPIERFVSPAAPRSCWIGVELRAPGPRR